MPKDQAIKVLIQVAHVAQSKGVLTLKEAPIVASAVQALSVEEPTTNQNQDAKSDTGTAEGSTGESK